MTIGLRVFALFIFCGGCGGPSCSHVQKVPGAYAWSPGITALPNASGDDKPVCLLADERGRVQRVRFGNDGEPEDAVLFPNDICGDKDVIRDCRLATRPDVMTYALEQHALRGFDDDGKRAWVTEGANLPGAVLTIDQTGGAAIAEIIENGALGLRRIAPSGQGTSYTFSIFDSTDDAASSMELSSLQLVHPLFDGDLLVAGRVRLDPSNLAVEHSFLARVSPEAEVRWAKRFTDDVLGVERPEVLGAREFASGEILIVLSHRKGIALVLSADGEVLRQGESQLTFETNSAHGSPAFAMASTGDHILLPAVSRGALQVDRGLSTDLEFTTAAALRPTDGHGTVLGERPDLLSIQTEGDRVFFQIAGPKAALGITSLTQTDAETSATSLNPRPAVDSAWMTQLDLRVMRSVRVEAEAWTVPALPFVDPPLSPITADCSGDNSPC